MRFLIDAQLPPRLVAALRNVGHEAEHVFDVGLVAAPDIEIWRYAERAGAAIVTKDSDFVAIRMQAADGPVVIWLRLGNVPNIIMQQTLIAALPEIAVAIEAKDKLIEIR